MNERTKESLSALLDNEADDLELRRILAQAHDDEVMEVWCRYHQIRAGMNAEESAWAHVDLRQGIASRLDEELADDATDDTTIDHSDAVLSGSPKVPVGHSGAVTTTRFPWWGGAAIAASVAFAVVFLVQTTDLRNNTVPQIVETGVQSSGTEVASTAGSGEIEFSDEHEQRLNAYLMKHAGNAALNGGRSVVPYARLTSFEPTTEIQSSVEGVEAELKGKAKPQASSEPDAEAGNAN
ncbi:sigma-E factor negative regulatory protein [Hahella ganghwensis]|uniref:sigma-E factor negative regulatory protein n=1 Tax=Hahella ganghwensis TaxID=286420 RepID=UPI00036AF6B1|nr:sigma-E factor negative regulatory protein [Hahella ganghwensis]